MTTLLDDQLVADALVNLSDWSGDAKRISRTVSVDDPDALCSAVAEAADAMDHHPEVQRDGDAVTFTLWTHSKGGVTELDIALASRIDDLILTAQHRRRPPVHAQPTIEAGEQTTPSRPEASSTGEAYPEEQRGAPTFNEAAVPREDAGAVVAPDASPRSAEPQPGNAGPGMHEGVDEK